MSEKHVHHSREELLGILRDFADDLGRPPRLSDLNESDEHPSQQPYYSEFGSWNSALEEAGLAKNATNEFGRDELLEIIQDLGDTQKRAPLAKDLKSSEELPHPSTYRREFGSWNNALREAGFEVLAMHSIPRETLLEKVQELHDRIGRVPTTTDLKEHNSMPSAGTYREAFGSWNNVLRKIGLEPHYEYEYDRADLLEDLHRLTEELGRAPSVSEVRERKTCASVSTYQNEFGSWREALWESGLGDSVRTHHDSETWTEYRYGPNWKENRKKALERDDRECRICDSSDETTLHVHHITPRCVCFSDDDCEWKEVNSLQNLITLCGSCHKRFEGHYQETTPEEFVDQARDYLRKSSSTVR